MDGPRLRDRLPHHLPRDQSAGSYGLVAGLAFESAGIRRPIELGLSEEHRLDRRYRLTEITLQ